MPVEEVAKLGGGASLRPPISLSTPRHWAGPGVGLPPVFNFVKIVVSSDNSVDAIAYRRYNPPSAQIKDSME